MAQVGKKAKKAPLRMCVACQNMRAKRELMRVVAGPEGDIAFDPTGRAPGRGAYICQDRGCLAKAIKEKRLERALKSPIPAEAVARLEELLTDGEDRAGS